MILFLGAALLGVVFFLTGREDVNYFAKIDSSALYPPFKERLQRVLRACQTRGAVYEVTSGFRSYESQDEIYKQGRTKPGEKVTEARGGESQHNFGIAVDVVLVRNGRQSWAPKDFDILIEEVKREGLHTGENYADLPHVGWPEYFRGGELAVLDSVYRRDKNIVSVWRFLDSTLGVA